MTIYYRVDLEKGISIEDREPVKKEGKRNKVAYYSDSPELGETVFKSIRDAKRKFNQITKDEIKRLQALRISVRCMNTRKEMASHVAAE